jgi:phosphate transport system substrate-binding protein
MKITLSSVGRQLFVSTLAVGSILLAGVAQPTAPNDSKNILVDGSSTVAPITKAVAEEFKKTPPGAGVNVTVGVSGTGGGFRRYCANETDIQDASRAITKSEIDTCSKNGVEYVELIVGLDGITVAVSRNSQIFGRQTPCMTVGELNLLWAKESDKFVTKWNQIRADFANQSITLSGAASTSGTFDFFNEAVNGAAKDARSDYFGTEEDQLLAQQTGANPSALTYFGYAFFVNNSQIVQPVAIDPRTDLINAPADVLAEINKRREANKKKPLVNGGGACKGILPSVDSIGAFIYQPLSRPLYIYVSKKSGERKAVADFINFYLDEKQIGNQQFMLTVGYLPIPREDRDASRQCWSKRKTGSAFGGDFGSLSLKDIKEKYTKHCGS